MVTQMTSQKNIRSFSYSDLEAQIAELEDLKRSDDERLQDYMNSVDYLNDGVRKSSQEIKRLNRIVKKQSGTPVDERLFKHVEKVQASLVKALRKQTRLQREKDTAVHKSGELYWKNRELADLSVSLVQMTGLAEQREEQCQARDDDIKYHQWKLIVESLKRTVDGKDHIINQLQEANNDLRRQLGEWHNLIQVGDDTDRSPDLPDELTFLDQAKANGALSAFLASHPPETCAAIDCLIKNNSLMMAQIQQERRHSTALQKTIDHMHSARDWNDYHSDDSTNYDR
jgi:predicted  nucleic acid-binding Zn-ribbon protein